MTVLGLFTRLSIPDIAAKMHKIHKNNNLYIGISNSYWRQKYKFGLFTSPTMPNIQPHLVVNGRSISFFSVPLGQKQLSSYTPKVGLGDSGFRPAE